MNEILINCLSFQGNIFFENESNESIESFLPYLNSNVSFESMHACMLTFQPQSYDKRNVSLWLCANQNNM